MSEETKKRLRVTLEPKALRQLVNHYGAHNLVAQELGCSPEHVSRSLRTNEVASTTELAARHILSKVDKATNARAILICSVPAKDRAMLEAMLTKMGIEFKSLVS